MYQVCVYLVRSIWATQAYNLVKDTEIFAIIQPREVFCYEEG